MIYGRGDGNIETTPWSSIVIDAERSGSDFSIVNVTVDDLAGNNYIMHAQYDHPTIPVNLLIKNTIFSSRGPNAPIFLAQSVNFTIDHNLFYIPNSDAILHHGNNTYNLSQVGSLGPGNKYGDPLFINPTFGSLQEIII